MAKLNDAHVVDLEKKDPSPTETRSALDEGETTSVVLGWRTWVVVFISAYLTIFMQIFTTVAAPGTIAFIVQDLGDQNMSAWVLQAPLLVQATLNPVVGRLSDILDRKTWMTITPLIAFAGSVMSAKANGMNMLIAGGVLYGITLATISIAQSIPAEILPLKYRTVASGISFIGGASGGLVAGLAAGAFCQTPTGWRNMFWVQAGLQLLVSALFFVFYWPPKSNREYPKMKIMDLIWACDPIGSVLFIGGATLVLTGLNWASGSYPWKDAHVVAPLTIGLVSLAAFGVYEWKGRSDGLLAHALFASGPNFPLSLFACLVEGWMYYSAVNTVTNQMQFFLSWETNSLLIGVRQLAYSIPTLLGSVLIIWYSTRYKDVKWPLIICFILFLIVACAFAGVQRSWGDVQLGLSVIAGLGQAGPLILLVSVTQFAAPHAYLSTATGAVLAARAIGGAFGSAILYTIAFGHVHSNYSAKVAAAAVSNGLAPESVPVLLSVMAEGHGPPTEGALVGVLAQALPSATMSVIGAARTAGQEVYAKGFALAWASIIPVAFIAVVCCALLRDVSKLMTDEVEAPLENVPSDPDVKKVVE